MIPLELGPSHLGGNRLVAFPFFERYTRIDVAAADKASGDGWCINADGPFWHTLFAMEAATGNLARFSTWLESQDEFYQEQARERLVHLKELDADLGD